LFRCGYQWTNKLEGMFKDVQLSKDLMSDFRKIFDSEAQLDIALDVNVVRN
jgi:cullin-4